MQIAVLGGGNSSFAAAADVALSGHAVWLWRRDQAAVAAQTSGNTSVVKDFRPAAPKFAAVTNDIGVAVRGADLIICPVPATAHHDIARLPVPHLSDGQMVYLPPGTFGSVLFAKAAPPIGEQNLNAD